MIYECKRCGIKLTGASSDFRCGCIIAPKPVKPERPSVKLSSRVEEYLRGRYDDLPGSIDLNEEFETLLDLIELKNDLTVSKKICRQFLDGTITPDEFVKAVEG